LFNIKVIIIIVCGLHQTVYRSGYIIMDGAFRKIDIDQWDEEKLIEEELYEPYSLPSPQAVARAKELEREVRGLLTRGDMMTALRLVLTDPPYGPDHTEAKSIALSTISSIIFSTKSADISGLIRQLNQQEQDNLMKYIYKGMETPDETGGNACAILLGWHEKLIEVAGLGSIARVMTDHRRV